MAEKITRRKIRMRNLKRALSLTLASVMLLGMMVIGTSAAVAYPDVDKDNNVEAIEVLQAVKVMQGDDKGNFDPDRSVSRNEMAIVMAKLLNLDYNYYKDTCPFWDVPDYAKPYVAACYANGIVSGYNATTFGGADTVTAVQAASMMMRALGYFQYQSDYEDNFVLSTVKQASKIRLFDGINANQDSPLTRDQVARLALNALESGMVDPDDDTLSVTLPDGSQISKGKVNYVYRSSTQKFANTINTTETNASTLTGVNGSVVELGEQLYNGDLKRTATTDDFGAPSVRWTYKNSEVGNYADEADYVFEGTVKSSAMYDAVGKTVAEDYTWTVKMDGATEANAKKYIASDMKFFTRKDVEDNDKDDLDGTGRGTTTYVYLNDSKDTATVCIVNTYAAEITKVSGETITLDDMDESGLEFDINGYAEEDVVLYNKSVTSSGAWTVETILGKAELVEGEADTIRDKDRVVIGDTTYRYSSRYNDAEGSKLGVDSVDENVAFYIDKQGNIILLADAVESNDYAYVYSVGNANSKYGDDAEYGAKLILTDGSVKNVDIDSDDTDAWTKDLGLTGDSALKALRNGATKSTSWSAAEDNSKVSVVVDDTKTKKAPLVGQIVSYTEDGGIYSLDVKTTDYSAYDSSTEGVVKNGNSRIKLKDSTIYTDKNSAILVNPSTEDNDEFDAYVGYNNAPSVDVTNASRLVAYVKDGIVKAVFISEAEVTGSDEVIFVIGANSPKENGTGSNKYYVYDAVVNGEITSIRVKSGSDAASTLSSVEKNEIGIFFGMTQNSSDYVTKLTTKLPKDIAVNDLTAQNDSTPEKGGNWTAKAYIGTHRATTDGLLGFGWDSTEKEYTVRPAANDDAMIVYYDGSDLSLESLHNDRNDKAWVITDDGKVTAVFVWEVKDGEEDENNGGSDSETPAFGLTIKGETLTFTYAESETSAVRTAIRELLEDAGYTDVKITTADGKITKVTAMDGEDEVTFVLKADCITPPAGDSDLPQNSEYKTFMSYPTQTFDGETMTLSMKGDVKAVEKAGSSESDAEKAVLGAFANSDNNTFSKFEELYDLKTGTWGFVVVNIDGSAMIMLVGERKDTPQHSWDDADKDRPNDTVSSHGKGIVVRNSATHEVTFLSEYYWKSKGVTINASGLKLPTAPATPVSPD
ncbi:S-layer homology domain-containing protein [bacterium 1xD42-67]|nr:S-layer homology domain-containing protein [bacterium 1xD42-67]